ncbi:uncharacterized protein LOC133888743 isoform X2 [Phragmites australis]|uniref:uncharacterized protein LOC133888743 isoform X2 n=1 Tax=Phragmites australis TaxID=29695 RepID=UPI002D79E2BF|nr:uncharacterized protein LOC133888743 isoform X2 [Phragmites australis]
MASEGNKDVANEALSMEQSSTSGAKRKRGRPRKYEYHVDELPQRARPIQSIPPLHCTQGGSSVRQDGLQASHTSGESAHGNQFGRPRNSANLVKASDNQASYYSSAPLQVNSGKDDILGKHFVGKLTKKFPGFSLITVKVKDNQVFRGWVPDENNLRPITPKDDLAPELPMLRPSQVRKRASAINMQAAPTVPIHLEDVTLAKPLQMRRPVEKTIAKHIIPLAPRPHMGPGVVAAVPMSVSPSTSEMRTLAKQDTELVIPQPSVAAVPIKSIQPVLVSCKQVAKENELVGVKYVNEFQKDFKPSNGTNESSGVGDQPKSANSEHWSSKEASDVTEQSEQLKIETGVLKGVDGSKSGASDDVQSVHDEHEMRIGSK